MVDADQGTGALEHDVIIDVIDGVVRVAQRGATNADLARPIAATLREKLTAAGGSPRMLLDINQAGRPSTEAREIYFALIKEVKGLRVAVLASHPVARAIAQFLLAIATGGTIKVFATEPDAMAWLQADAGTQRGGD